MAWVFQDKHLVAKHGPKRTAWSVGWYEPDGTKRQKSFGTGTAGSRAAFRYQKQLEAQLLTGTYDSKRPVSWRKFVKEFKADRAAGMSAENRRCVLKAVAHFERLCNPGQVRGITRKTLDRYVVRRQSERGHKRDSKVSPATIAKDLRYLKSVLKVAAEWGYLPAVPSVPRVRVPEKLVRFVTPEHFTAIYNAADGAVRPEIPNVSPGDWWRAALVFCYLTGWRIGELLKLKATDLDLAAGTAVTRHGDNKGKRDERVLLHPLIVEHLRRLPHFDSLAFPWPHGRKSLWTTFQAIQRAAGVSLECHEKHKHTETCGTYGFHDLRRSFATENADSLTAKELQTLMRHRSFSTTMKYIGMGRGKQAATTSKLFVPKLRKRAAK